MIYEKLGQDIYIPAKSNLALKKINNIKFNYQANSSIKGNLIELDLTSKLFAGNAIYIRKSCYRIKLGEIEDCVKANSLDHMRALGISVSNIPDSLKNLNFTNRNRSYSENSA